MIVGHAVMLLVGAALGQDGYQNARWGMTPEQVVQAQSDQILEELDLFDWKWDLWGAERRAYKKRTARGERKAHRRRMMFGMPANYTVWDNMHCYEPSEAFYEREHYRVLVAAPEAGLPSLRNNWDWVYQHRVPVAGHEAMQSYCFAREGGGEHFGLDRVQIVFSRLDSRERDRLVRSLEQKYGRPKVYTDKELRSYTTEDTDVSSVYDGDGDLVGTIERTTEETHYFNTYTAELLWLGRTLRLWCYSYTGEHWNLTLTYSRHPVETTLAPPQVTPGTFDEL
jgi:hypothetical protein